MYSVSYSDRPFGLRAAMPARRRCRSAIMVSCSVLALLGMASGMSGATYETDITSDTTLTSPVTIPPGYTQLDYGIGNGATLTLGSGANSTSTFYVKALSGGGKLVNNATITSTGSAIAYDGLNSGPLPSVINNGTIQSTVVSGQYAIATGFYGLGNLINTGTITATGTGGGVDAGGNYSFTNTGSVTADGTAVHAFDNVITNSGTIRSNNGVGLDASGNQGYLASNSGLIYGKTVGVQLFGYTLTNSGTITSPSIAVSVNSGTLVNTTSGVVNGKIGNALYQTSSAEIDNAGVINGNVDFGSAVSYYGTHNRFIALPGSVVNGNLVLGGGNDTFATSLINTGPGQYAGITGTLTAGGTGTDTIRYFVTSDATLSSLAQQSAFGTLKYDLSNNSKLTITAASSPFSSISFSGTGTVDVSASITSNYNSIFDLTEASLQTDGSGNPIPTALNFTSRGTLTQIATNSWQSNPAVHVSNGTTFINAGTIIAQSPSSEYLSSPRMAAIFGGGTVINNGTINLLAVDGISEDTSVGSAPSQVLTVINNGTIQQTADGNIYSRGVLAESVTNTGTITTGGEAVILYGYGSAPSLINSGQITSTTKSAVHMWLYRLDTNGSIANQAGGVITGKDAGVETYWLEYWASRTSISNAGTISGGNYGLSLTGGGSVTNSGTISGGIDSIISSGPLTLTLQTGSNLVGDVMGCCSNALILQGSGSEDNAFLNFASLDMQGPGVWTLSGNNTIAGTTVSAGTLVLTGALTSTYTINSGATLQGSTSTLLTSAAITDNGTLVFNQTADGSFSGAITGSGAVTKTGSGNLTFTAANSYSGGTIINAGTLNVLSDSQIGASSGSVTLDGGTLRFGSQFNLASTRKITVGSSGGSFDTNGFNTTLVQAISGNGSLTITGGGNLILSAGSTYTGATTIQAGTLALSGSGSIASSSGVIDNATFDITATTSGATVTTLAGNGTVVQGNKTLAISNGSSEFSGVIGGNGGLVLSGGAEILSGTNTYTGGTTIASGATLQLGNGGTTGSILGNVVDNGVLVFDRSDIYTFSGDLSGTGAISLTGSGRVIFTGQNSLTGGLGIGSGSTVHMTDLGTISGPITNNGTLDFNGSGNLSFANTIAGSGSLTFTGGGTLILSGANTYTGNTFVDSGTLSISSDANLGNGGTLILASGTGVILTGSGTITHSVTVAGDPTFTVASGTTTIWSGQISDGAIAGDVEVTGGGTLILTGTNSYTGGTAIHSGTLQLGNGGTTGSVIGNITDNATLAFNRSDDLSFASVISGTGSLTKSNSNTLTLNGVSGYTGATTVTAGRLAIGDATHSTATLDSHVGGVTVAAGASLSGFGKVAGTVTNNGAIVTGLSAGSLTVGGLTQNAGSTLVVDLSPSASSHLTVSGTATLGGTLRANILSDASTAHVYSILSAGRINGTFATMSLTGTAPDAVYGLRYAPSGQEVDIVTLPQSAGQVYGDLRVAAFDTAFALNAVVMDRLGSEAFAPGAWTLWARGILGSAHTDGANGASAFNNTLAGVIGGADYGFTNGMSAHAAIAYGQSDLKVSGHNTKASTGSLYVSLAGHAPVSGFALDAEGFYLSNSTSLTRDTEFAGIASAKPDSSVFGFAVQMGFPLLQGDLVPSLRLSYAGFNPNAVSEVGADPMDLAVASADTSELRGDFGVRYSHHFASNDTVLIPSLKIFLDQTLSAAPDRMTMQLLGTSASFAAPSAVADRTAALIGVGLRAEFGNALSLNFDLDSRVGPHQTALMGTAGLEWHF